MSNQWYDIDIWQWTDNPLYEWGFEEAGEEGLNQIWTDENYVYAVTSSGLNIIDIETEELYSKEISHPYSTVWADDNYVFLGTDVGVKRLSKSDIVPVEIFCCLTDYAVVPNLSSNVVRYIHGNSNYLMCCTEVGVDIIRLDIGNRYHTTIIEGAWKCFAARNNKFYYTTSENDVWKVNRLDFNNNDWVSPDYIYTTGTGILLEGIGINDLFVTDGTASDGMNNTLMLATTSGIYVIDEGNLDHSVYYTVGG